MLVWRGVALKTAKKERGGQLVAQNPVSITWVVYFLCKCPKTYLICAISLFTSKIARNTGFFQSGRDLKLTDLRAVLRIFTFF